MRSRTNGMLQALARMARLVAAPADPADARSRKAIFILAALLFVPPSLLWSLIYVVAGERVAAAIPSPTSSSPR